MEKDSINGDEKKKDTKKLKKAGYIYLRVLIRNKVRDL